MKVIFTVGLPCSGKTVWAKEFCEKNKDWVRVNRDDLRRMRGSYWIPKQEDMITEWERYCILNALMFDKNVIVDATNLNENHKEATKNWLRNDGKSFGLASEIIFESKLFDTSLEVCIKNDLKRENSVGEKVIREMYNKYLKPKTIKYQYDVSLPDCVICDLDGTLALFGNKNPYERDFENDMVNEVVRDMFELSRKMYGTGFIFSGRSDKFFDVTKEWLTRYGIKYDLLVMRKEGDRRKDCIVKEEMFNEYVRGKYNPKLVLDDRNQIVEYYRSLGLTVFQVADGNF